MRDQLSYKWISGSGIEIGGLHCPLSVKTGVTVKYVDRVPYEDLHKVHGDVTAVKNAIIVDNAETLSTFEDETQDFVIANHVYEHTEDPIRTLENWLRVLKPGGVIYAAIPDKRFTFDRKRECTPFAHLMYDYVNGPLVSRMDHYIDWFTNADFSDLGIHVKERADAAFKEHANIHFHVWDYNGIAELFEQFRIRFGLTDLALHQNGSEVIVICKKGV